MKKSAIILFLGLLMYNTVGFIINFQFVLAEWRHEMRVFLNQNIPEKDLICFTFKQSTFDSTTKEFSKDNKLYDVVKTEVSGDNVIVYCYNDEKETRLSSEFNDLLFQNTTSKGDCHKKMLNIFKHMQTEYVFENYFHLQNYPPSVFSRKKGVLDYKTPHFPLPHFDILTPPPQQIG